MHIVTMAAYGLTVWLSAILYTAATGEHLWTVTACGPLIVSGAIVFLLALDWAASRFE